MFEIEGGVVQHHVAASPIARMIEDDTHLLWFDPTAPLPPLQDPNPDGFSTQKLREGCDACLDGFVRFVHEACEGIEPGDPVVEEYRRLHATYAVGGVFGDGPERWVHLTLGAGLPRVARSEGRCAPADAGHRSVASALTAWAAREKSYFYLRAFSRQWSTLYTLSREDGEAAVEPKQPQDLLAYYLLRKAKGAELAIKQWLDHQLARYARAG